MDSKTLAIVAALVLATTGSLMAFNSSESRVSDFETFKVKYNKVYSSDSEEAFRFAVYAANMKDAAEHNAKGTETFTKGETVFTDMTKEEFKNIYLGFKQEAKEVTEVNETYEFVGSVNWVTKGDVQKVKNQGQCGSCWAFSTVAACESWDAISQGTLGDFSEQQLVDCSGSYGNNGCSGGLMDNGFKYFIANGICTESSYPYQGVDGTCQASSCTKSGFTITSYSDVSAGSTSALKSRCDKQPVAIACDASQWSSYTGGIFSNCGTSLDHGILLAGYTSSYWLVKNSWGASWGENGYIRLAPGNTCGLANSASTPI